MPYQNVPNNVKGTVRMIHDNCLGVFVHIVHHMRILVYWAMDGGRADVSFYRILDPVADVGVVLDENVVVNGSPGVSMEDEKRNAVMMYRRGAFENNIRLKYTLDNESMA